MIVQRILQGDVREVLRTLPDSSIHCCVTSPPYWGLRDYGVPGQLGLEKTPEEYIAKMVEVFQEVRRVLRNDGSLWLNLGSSYASGGGSGSGEYQKRHKQFGKVINGGTAQEPRSAPPGFKSKDLIMIPAMVALALQSDGWWLRSDIIWAKPNPMPESVTDRPTTAHEHIFLLTKSARYFYDAEAVREENTINTIKRLSNGPVQAIGDGLKRKALGDNQGGPPYSSPNGRNLRSVWTLATEPFPEAHFATFPTSIPERCIKAGTSEKGVCPKCGAPWKRVVERTVMEIRRSDRDFKMGVPEGKRHTSGTMTKAPTSTTLGWQPPCKCPVADPIPATVLDPFAGSGTTLLVARRLGRHSLGIELSPEYIEIANRRLREDAPTEFLTGEVLTGTPTPEAKGLLF